MRKGKGLNGRKEWFVSMNVYGIHGKLCSSHHEVFPHKPGDTLSRVLNKAINSVCAEQNCVPANVIIKSVYKS